MLEIGIKGHQELVVSPEVTAESFGSGQLPVYATPAMIAFMEYTAYKSVAPYLEEGCGTVGTEVKVKHVAATPVGMKVSCETELIAINGRALTFKVKAMDECGVIGEGTHERFIIQSEKFLGKTNAKLEGKG